MRHTQELIFEQHVNNIEQKIELLAMIEDDMARAMLTYFIIGDNDRSIGLDTTTVTAIKDVSWQDVFDAVFRCNNDTFMDIAGRILLGKR